MIGCVLLVQPFFLDERGWIQSPGDWSREMVRGKTYDLSAGEGGRIGKELLERRISCSCRQHSGTVVAEVGTPVGISLAL